MHARQLTSYHWATPKPTFNSKEIILTQHLNSEFQKNTFLTLKIFSLCQSREYYTLLFRNLHCLKSYPQQLCFLLGNSSCLHSKARGMFTCFMAAGSPQAELSESSRCYEQSSLSQSQFCFVWVVGGPNSAPRSLSLSSAAHTGAGSEIHSNTLLFLFTKGQEILHFSTFKRWCCAVSFTVLPRTYFLGLFLWTLKKITCILQSSATVFYMSKQLAGGVHVKSLLLFD